MGILQGHTGTIGRIGFNIMTSPFHSLVVFLAFYTLHIATRVYNTIGKAKTTRSVELLHDTGSNLAQEAVWQCGEVNVKKQTNNQDIHLG